MSDETTAEETAAETTETDVKDWKAEAEKWQTLARKNEERAKGNAQAAKELERVRAAAMTETEKAVAEAKTAGAAEAARAAAPRLVKAELRAAAADAGLPKEALAGFLEYADLSRFVADDGEVDDKAISAAIKKLGGGKPADFDGGARTTAPKGADMNSLIRHAAGVS
jgi:cell wall-associated NlpC family hydrolase